MKLLFWACVILLTTELKAQFTLQTIAGTGQSGNQNGQATQSTFNRVTHVVRDSKGNLFVTDLDNHCIRKIDPNGLVSTFAGSCGSIGFADGQGGSARFNWPFYMAIDAFDNLYVSDAKNHAIRKISPTGAVTTLAGNGVNGLVDGVGSTARFDHPYGICFDPNGDLIITDRFNHALRKLTLSTKMVTTLAGGNEGFVNGPLANAQFSAPHGIVHVGNGVYFVADRGNGRIRKIDGTIVTTYAGSGIEGFKDGNLTTAQFSTLSGIDADAQGNLYIGDYGNNAIRKISTTQVSTLAGNGIDGFQDGNPLTNCLRNPHGITVLEDGCASILIADHFNHAVRLLNCDITPEIPEDTTSFIAIPNVFSPNNDGVNDFFNVEGHGLHHYKIQIFNRWGAPLFTGVDLGEPWDGSFNANQVAEGVYMFIITYDTPVQKGKQHQGHLTLFR
jgi:gliding motility-associated-like protein